MSADPLGLDLTEADATLVGTVATLTGSVFGDCFTIGSAFVASVPGATSGLISAGTGFDLLRTNANLAGTVFSGIEETQLLETNGTTVDAAQIANLGAISIFDSVVNSTAANLALSSGDGQTADFSNLTLQDGEALRVSVAGLGTGQTITSDFTAATFLGTSGIVYTGGNQDDSVLGGAGEDSIIGGNGDDRLDGGAGNDSISDTGGADSLFGGSGDDELRIAGSGGSLFFTVLVDGGADQDIIRLSGRLPSSTIIGGDGVDELRLEAASLIGATFTGIEATTLFNFNTVDAAQIANLGAMSITGGSASNLALSSGDGQTADFSNLTLQDGEALRVSVAGLGTGQTITSDFTAATFLGTSGIFYTGGNQDDSVLGGAGEDSITGGNGDDRLDGGAGNDSISDTRGADSLFGGNGDDELRIAGPGGSLFFTVLVDGGADQDIIRLSGRLPSSTIIGGDGVDELRLEAASLIGATFTGIEATTLFNFNTVDAAQIANLGAMSITGGSASNLALSSGDGQTADFSNLTLQDGEALRVSVAGLGTGQTITSDFTAATFLGTSGIFYTGGNQDDSVLGGAGEDSITGGNGDDRLDGGAGNDSISDTRGADSLFGGNGDDELRIAGPGGSLFFTVLVDGGADQDIIRLSGRLPSSTIIGGDGVDELRLEAASLIGATFTGIEATTLFNFNTVDAAQIANLGAMSITGGSASNLALSSGDGQTADFSNLTLQDGEALRVSVAGLGTGQTITSDFTAATFLGTSGIFYTGGNQDDSVLGGAGEDSITGGNGDDRLDGGAGNDSISDTRGADSLFGGNGDDELRIAGPGGSLFFTVLVDGGADQDIIRLSGRLPSSTIIGGDGVDELRLEAASLIGATFTGIEATTLFNFNTVDAAQIANLGAMSITGGSASNLALSSGDGQTADFSNLTLQDGEALRVSVAGLGTGQTITSDFTAATFLGTSGIFYTGGNQDDSVLGGAGEDSITGGNGDDRLDGGAGNDSISDTRGADSLFGGNGDDELRIAGPGGSLFFTVLVDGGADQDIIRLSGRLPSSTIIGGDGVDELRLEAASLIGATFTGIEATTLFNFNTVDAAQIANLGAMSITGGSASNLALSSGDGQTADFSNLTLQDGEALRVSVAGLGTGQTITSDFTAATFLGTSGIFYTGGNQDDSVLGGAGEDSITGGNGDDRLDGGAGNDAMFGGSGADHLAGGRQSDFLVGATGDDTLFGGLGGDQMRGNAGNDTLNGDEGNDRLFGNEGEDLINGGENNDRILGGTSGDVLYGGIGDDDVFGQSGTDVVYGGIGDDDVRGNSGADSVFGGDGDDLIFGNENPDALYGGLNDDILYGGSGLDVLYGGAGEDVLNGGASSDQMTGGLDADTFQFTVAGGIDRITDWQDGIDVLDFTADGLNLADFAVSTFGGGAGTKIVGGGYVVFFEGIAPAAIDALDFL